MAKMRAAPYKNERRMVNPAINKNCDDRGLRSDQPERYESLIEPGLAVLIQVRSLGKRTVTAGAGSRPAQPAD
jgi:hypothetical protein